MISDKKVFFIVGNSRSGTTMLMRILNNHSAIASINEPHFFERYWSPTSKTLLLSKEEGTQLFSKLLFVQRDGLHKKIDPQLYWKEADAAIQKIDDTSITKLKLYQEFLHYETGKQGKQIPCEKTPQNIFYITEILKQFPNALVINMIRDPRSVLLSQKKKWKRRKLGANFLSTKELIRLRINYHPITISKLWNSALQAANNYNNNSRFKSIYYEDLISAPHETIKELCNFLNVPFSEKLLDIPQKGSSSKPDDPNAVGIRSDRVDAWRKGGLNKTELFICEKLTHQLMKTHHYSIENPKPSLLYLAYYFISFPIKILLALLWNWRRVKNLFDTIKRRLSR